MTPTNRCAQIGDVILTPLPDGRLELKIDDALVWTTWDPTAAQIAIAYLKTWLDSLEVSHE